MIGIRRGTGKGPKVLIEGHMDTVFPFGTVKGVEEKDGFLYAPGSAMIQERWLCSCARSVPSIKQGSRLPEISYLWEPPGKREWAVLAE